MPFAGSYKKQYLCTVKRIEYIAPIEYICGNISGRQQLTYTAGGGGGYDAPSGVKTSALDYSPRMIARIRYINGRYLCKYFQVRTRTSVNMTAAYRLNLAIMGGAGALFASLVNNKSAQIYNDCVSVCPANITLRAFVVPLLRSGLAAKSAHIQISGDIYIVNPWVSDESPNVNVSSAIINKFSSELSNS